MTAFPSPGKMLTPLAKAVLAFLLLAPALSASRALHGQEVPEVIAPGLVYLRYQKEGLVGHVLKMDLKAADLRLRSIKAKGKESIRQLHDRLDGKEATILAALNGDYFRMESEAGLPYGVQVSDGRLIFAPMKRSMIGFGPKNEPYVGVVSLSAKLSFSSGTKQRSQIKWTPVDGINVLDRESSRQSGIYLYTPAFLGLNLSRPNGLIMVLEAVEPALQVGDVCEGKIARMEPSGKSINVPEAGCLLYFFGAAAKPAAQVKVGQAVTLKIELPPIVGGVSQAIGGGPRLIRDGKKSIEIDKEDFASFQSMGITARHPRSAIGFDRSKGNLFLVMVEGRQRESRGMTFGELATFMGELGCYQAMAFDGGGSAAMYVQGKGIVSRSMGGFDQPEEREIANALLITAAKAPEAKTQAGEGKKEEPKTDGASPAGPQKP
jgi:hypothetical protein